MAKRRTTPKELPEAMREAVERTVQATLGSAQVTRDRAQEMVDDLVKGAEQGAEDLRDRVGRAFEERRPVTSDDLSGIREELRAIGRRLDRIEERLPARRRASGKSGGGTRGRTGQQSR